LVQREGRATTNRREDVGAMLIIKVTMFDDESRLMTDRHLSHFAFYCPFMLPYRSLSSTSFEWWMPLISRPAERRWTQWRACTSTGRWKGSSGEHAGLQVGG
jgi:hypothetical protein